MICTWSDEEEEDDDVDTSSEEEDRKLCLMVKWDEVEENWGTWIKQEDISFEGRF